MQSECETIMDLSHSRIDGYCSPKRRKQSDRREYTVNLFTFSTLQLCTNRYFEIFPRELFAIVLAFLDRNSLCIALRICKSWACQISNEYLWKLLYERDVEEISHNTCKWKDLYYRWVISNGIDLHLDCDKTNIKKDDKICFTVTVTNKRNVDVNLVDGHSVYGSDLQNGAIFKLQSADIHNMKKIEHIPVPSQHFSLQSGSFNITTISANSSICFTLKAMVGTNWYLFSSWWSVQYALQIPSSPTHTLCLCLQRPSMTLCDIVWTSRTTTINTNAKIWSGCSTSNSITINTIA